MQWNLLYIPSTWNRSPFFFCWLITWLIKVSSTIEAPSMAVYVPRSIPICSDCFLKIDDKTKLSQSFLNPYQGLKQVETTIAPEQFQPLWFDSDLFSLQLKNLHHSQQKFTLNRQPTNPYNSQPHQALNAMVWAKRSARSVPEQGCQSGLPSLVWCVPNMIFDGQHRSKMCWFLWNLGILKQRITAIRFLVGFCLVTLNI